MVKYLIIGSGKSALGAARYLLSQGAEASLSDLKEPNPNQLKKIRELKIPLLVGPQDKKLVSQFDIIVLSPGIPLYAPVCSIANSENIPIVSEIDLSLGDYKGHQFAVTGTNGKSTTVTLLAHLLQQSGIDAEALGNLGTTPSEVLSQDKQPESVVLELSSYQLELANKIRASAAIFTSFSPDHLERHKTLRNYLLAKWNLASQVKENGVLILSESFYRALISNNVPVPSGPRVLVIQESPDLEVKSEYTVVPFSITQAQIDDRIVSLNSTFSRHDNLNLLSCIIAIHHVFPGLPYDGLVTASRNYKRLDHRFEVFASIDGHDLINDSKATNVESTCVALRSVKDPCYLLLGGADKGSSYKDILQHQARVSKIICFGSAGPKIASDLSDFDSQISLVSKLDDAIHAVTQLFSQMPAPILFSPACASFDEFLNFEERGLYFKEEILKRLEA